MIVIIIPILCLIAAAAICYVNAIDKMQDEHPDYKGDDFLN